MPPPSPSAPPAGASAPVGPVDAESGARADLPATLDTVAQLAGVSRTTVSRVVNDSPKVSPQARAAVEEAIEALGYVPNRAARSLVTRRTDTAALVMFEPESRVFADPFLATMALGISANLAESDVQLMILMANSEREQQKVGRYVRQGHVDGVILMSMHGAQSLPDELTRAGVPVVVSGRPTTERPIAYVDADNAGGSEAAVRHLVETGRRRIATITGPLEMAAAADRYDGYRRILRAAGLRTSRALVVDGDFSEEGGRVGMERLLRLSPELDAVFAASDAMAAGALSALAAAGRRVPDDVAVVGFDDVPLARYTMPPLTTVRQPLGDMASAMSAQLLRQMSGSGDELYEAVVCPTALVRRESA